MEAADPSLRPSTLTRDARAITIVKWQARWSDQTTMASWTRRVLPSVERWIGRPAGAPVTFHLAQALTGHGAFNDYLHRFGIIASPACPHCDAPVDNVEHTLFRCCYWDAMRAPILELLGHPIDPDDVDSLLCGNHIVHRRCFLDMVEHILDAKELAERARQRRPPHFDA